MRNILLIIIICIFSLNAHSQNIGVFNFSLILKNLESYKNFLMEIDTFKKKNFPNLEKEEKNLINNLKEIEDSKVLLSEIEYLSRISEFNERKDFFENKVNKLNKYLEENIINNEKIILNEIIKIVKQIAIERNIDIVFSDEQYFLSSDNVDLSGQIYNRLNKLEISLQLSDYE